MAMFFATLQQQQQQQQHLQEQEGDVVLVGGLTVNDDGATCSSDKHSSRSNNNNFLFCNGGLLDPSVAVANLIDLANDLYCKGKQEDALSLYHSALSYCRNPWNAERDYQRITEQLQWGMEGLQGLTYEQFLLVAEPDLPDTYQEDECDVGARAFRLPIFPGAALFSSIFLFSQGRIGGAGGNNTMDMDAHNNNKNSNKSTTYFHIWIVYTEILMMYNEALLHHSLSEYGESMRLYETVALTLSKIMPEVNLIPLMNHNHANNNTTTTAAASPLVLYQKLSELWMRVNNNMGQISYLLGLEDSAMDHFQAALVCANRRMAEEVETAANTSQAATVLLAKEVLCLDYATVLSNWCRVHWMSGDINDTVHQGLTEVLRIRSSILGWDHRDTASAHFNLGVADYARNCSEAALSHLLSYLRVAAREAKEMKDAAAAAAAATGTSSGNRNSMNQPTLDPIPALIYILLVKNEHKDDEIAQELVRGLRSLQEKRADAGPQGAEVASVLNFIGTLLFHQQDFEHALLFFQEELRLEENLVFNNDDDVSISVTCNNIGRILQELNRLPEAKHYYHRALKTHYGEQIEKWCSQPKGQEFCPVKWNAENLAGLPHSTMQLYSAVWYNLGLIHDKLGSYGEATNAFQVSLGLRRAMLGPNHADVACLLYNIGVLQMEQQKLLDATASFREALRIRQLSPATGHLNDFHVFQTLKKLAALHKAKGNISGALETLYEILNIQKIAATTTAGPSESLAKNKDIGTTLREIAELYHAAGNIFNAATLAQESIDVFRKIQLASSGSMDFVSCTEELVTGLLLLGSLNHENCEPTKARSLFQEASSMIRQVSSYFPTSTDLDAMHEVTQILAACHCAPMA